MNPSYRDIIQAPDTDRTALFLETATRLGTAIQNVEKDFWVCWVLDALFNGLEAGSPRLLFKGGTSLSKAFGLIPRFSEDIDITVFRDDIGQTIDTAELEALTGKQRRKRLDAIRDACQAFITGPLLNQLQQRATAEIGEGRFRLEVDPDDADGQTLLLWYPTSANREGEYIRSAVKIEAGAKSALDPHTSATVRPYIADEVPNRDLSVHNVTTVEAERTFWDKVVILHGLRQWYERRGVLRHGGQRVSRHYYDAYQLMRHPSSAQWLTNTALAEDCARHARMFFGSPDLGLDTATKGSFTITPSDGMHKDLDTDYKAMSGMVFGEVPSLETVLEGIEGIAAAINK